ncbi:MAG: DegT/DnrJ/EryC1/StrS family aminotransferase [Verrucomicrobiae bacterium]|nr:DegT/DnrJ/EryC1/StrS family aminotransferase [Verrucomicrobiae bacterium]
MKIPLSKVDIREEDLQRVQEVLRSGWIMQGPRVEQFEKAVADFCQAPHAVAVSSGTTALHLALEAAGVRPGDEVIVPSFSFVASANAVCHCGAKPVFCDVDPATFNMTPSTVEPLITSATRAILVVHQFGLPCDLTGFAALAEKKGVALVEDAACAIGSRYREAPVGNCAWSRAACLSFHPRKIVSTGEGGMVLTRDAAMAGRMRLMRNHGMTKNPTPQAFVEVAYNYRLTDMQAALGIGQMERLPATIAERRRLARCYEKQLGNDSRFILPCEPAGCAANHQSYMIRFRKDDGGRDRAAAVLAEKGVATRPSLPPIHLQVCYTRNEKPVSLPQTEHLAANGLILPFYNGLSDDEAAFVCATLKEAAD